MRTAICLILAGLVGTEASAQSRADTLAIFDAAARKIGFDSSVEPAPNWRVRATDSLTLSFAAFRKQPTLPPPESERLFCQGETDADSGRQVQVKLTFSGANRAVFLLTFGCTMQHQGKTWGFVQGDIISLERRDGVWVATEKASLIS